MLANMDKAIDFRRLVHPNKGNPKYWEIKIREPNSNMGYDYILEVHYGSVGQKGVRQIIGEFHSKISADLELVKRFNSKVAKGYKTEAVKDKSEIKEELKNKLEKMRLSI